MCLNVTQRTEQLIVQEMKLINMIEICQVTVLNVELQIFGSVAKFRGFGLILNVGYQRYWS